MSKQETITAATLRTRLAGSSLERALAQQLDNAGIEYEREYRFAAPRRWRADFRIEGSILVECQGVTYYGGALGRHQTATGMTDDCEKHNEAILMGFRPLMFTQMQIESGVALATIKQAVAAMEAGVRKLKRRR